jgi:hypothetical protein
VVRGGTGIARYQESSAFRPVRMSKPLLPRCERNPRGSARGLASSRCALRLPSLLGRVRAPYLRRSGQPTHSPPLGIPCESPNWLSPNRSIPAPFFWQRVYKRVNLARAAKPLGLARREALCIAMASLVCCRRISLSPSLFVDRNPTPNRALSGKAKAFVGPMGRPTRCKRLSRHKAVRVVF